MKFISYKCEFVGKINENREFLKNQTGKSRDFSKYPGPKLNRDPGN